MSANDHCTRVVTPEEEGRKESRKNHCERDIWEYLRGEGEGEMLNDYEWWLDVLSEMLLLFIFCLEEET